MVAVVLLIGGRVFAVRTLFDLQLMDKRVFDKTFNIFIN